MLGITRMSRFVPAISASEASVTPAAIDTSTASGLRLPAISRQATAACCGFTARNTSPAAAAAWAGESANRTPGTAAASRSRAGGCGS